MEKSRRHRAGGHRRWSASHVRRSLALMSDCASESVRKGPVLYRVHCYVRRLFDSYISHQCALMACACAFSAVLSLIPLLIIGIAGLGFLMGGSAQAVHKVVVAVRAYVPIDIDVLRPMLLRILQDRSQIGVLGLTGLLYGAHQTFLALEPSMNLVWAVAETRHWFHQRLLAIGATFIAILLLALNLAATALFAYIQGVGIPFLSNRTEDLLLRIAVGCLPVLFTTLLFTILYQILPARKVPWKPALVGAVVAAVLWELLKLGFSVFLVYVHSYDRLYGSLSGLVILVIWTYYTMAILLLGAEIAADFEATRHSMREAEQRAHSGADLAIASGNTGRPVDVPTVAVSVPHSQFASSASPQEEETAVQAPPKN